MNYGIVIQWSDEDQRFVVLLPEWGGVVAQPVADGATYAEAAEHGEYALETLIQALGEDGQPRARAKNSWVKVA